VLLIVVCFERGIRVAHRVLLLEGDPFFSSFFVFWISGIHLLQSLNQRLSKYKGQSGMNYPETYGTPDTSHRTKTKSQHRKIKRWTTRTPLPKQKHDDLIAPYIYLNVDLGFATNECLK
jgi:hypothetical protein